MTKALSSYSLSKSTHKKNRWSYYLLIALIANAAIWGSALLFIKLKKPVYTSTSTATLPETKSAANVNLPNIGQAYYENSSPYANSSIQDPRETYKIIAESEPVLRAAASQVNLPLEDFGKPRVKIVLNTTLMTFDFKGSTPEEARNKSLAFHQAFQTRLNQLRAKEIAQQDKGFQSTLDSAKQKLQDAQQKLSAFKANSGLVSNEQLRDLSANIEQLRRQKAEVSAQQQQISSRVGQLSANLNISSQQAADAFALQSDQIFQQNLKDYSDASASLTLLNAKFLPDHPTVIEQQAKRDASRTAFLSRSQELLGRSVDEQAVQQYALNQANSQSAREALFQGLVASQAEQRGLKAQAQEIDRQIAILENRLKNLAQNESTLDALKRDVQIAEAVFSSTLTKLDISRANAFGSYPLIQMLSEPTLAESPSGPKPELVLLGAALGSLFINTGITLLYLRKPKSKAFRKELETLELQQPVLGFNEGNISSPFL
ncbi:GumC family protein [Chroogloeocystis siderophila]|uniref:Lipopolysaccharide biosynthesis protein n=1 Tax=Chroogloeocystis siderophila 5.2 s.c.1 TaxID=247279 RepID=A0A1U7HC30_9CHRO|nr:hypothetical protein [Chroogloeocystis siderophila]OKH21129.1 hypothetical protein NIES1031_22330 [Chroogloeocystis siderophila 5.2 s.c.1]